jgi:PIN domain nuclease of toxin-antitoxin system
MRVLLDTHTFLWWIADDLQLSAQAREVIGDGANVLFFSAVSGWEIAIKAQLGKLRLPANNLEQFITEQLLHNSFTPLPVQLHHTLAVYHLPLRHRDPFDRLLVAQSQLENLPILTVDPLIAQYGVETIW